MSDQPGISAIRSQAHDEIAQIISRERYAIVDRWMSLALTEETSARQAQRNELQNDLLQFLEALSNVLARGTDPPDKIHEVKAGQHGIQRWQVGWSLAELITDYQLLRTVVLDHLRDQLERELSHHEGIAIGVAVDDAITSAVRSYVTQQNNELEESNRRLVEFVGVLGHELRNPMNSISMAIDLIDRTNEKRFVDEAKKVMNHGITQLDHLVNQMLHLSRIIRNDVDFEPQAVELGEILSHAIDSAQALIREKGHDFQAHLADEPVHLRGDASRLEQVFVNLLTNAAKYTPEHGKIELQMEIVKSDQICVSVRDNGNGISRRMLNQVFDLFSRDQSTIGGEDGLGVGLALVRTFVELHNGHVQVKSEGPGLGSEFIVWLPCQSTRP